MYNLDDDDDDESQLHGLMSSKNVKIDSIVTCLRCQGGTLVTSLLIWRALNCDDSTTMITLLLCCEE